MQVTKELRCLTQLGSNKPLLLHQCEPISNSYVQLFQPLVDTQHICLIP